MQEKLKLSKSDGASTPAEKRRMSNVPYASAVGSIMICVFLNGGVVDWKSTKQRISTTSSTDAKYIAAFDASKEANDTNGPFSKFNQINEWPFPKGQLLKDHRMLAHNPLRLPLMQVINLEYLSPYQEATSKTLKYPAHRN
ncbi:hypothetical protein Tco_0563329 [Tanacetum coccineum]